MVKYLSLILCFLFTSNLSWSQDSINLTIPIEIRAQSQGLTLDTISISRNQFLTYPGSFDDPSRLLIKHVGFSTANDQANSIIQDGLPPHYVKWSLHGAEILNPNHLANAGSLTDRNSASAGGVNIFSGQVIGNMNYTSPGSFKSINNLGGVVDFNIREPYKSLVHTHLSLIGLEVGGDRMIPDTDHKIMANYRYSTVGLLSQLGLDFGDEQIKYQDLIMSLNLKNMAWGDYNIYISLGNSSTVHDALEDSLITEFKDNIISDYRANIFIIGIHQKDKKGGRNIENTFNYSRNGTAAERNFSLYNVYKQTQDQSDQLYSLHSLFSLERGNNIFTLGALNNHYRYGTYSTDWHFTLSPYLVWERAIGGYWKLGLNAKAMWETFSPYSSKHPKQPTLQFNFQPSLYLERRSESWAFSLNYARSEQMQTLELYDVKKNGFRAVANTPLDNSHLLNTKAHQLNIQIQKGLWGLRVFYQYLYDIPSVHTEAFFFTDLVAQDYLPYTDLNNEGKASIYGFNVTNKKNFGLFNMFTNLTIQNGKQSVVEKRDIHIPYDFGYLFNLMLDKKFVSSHGKYLGISLSFHGRGGAWESTVKNEFKFHNITEYNSENPYSVQLSDYFRADLRIVFVKKKFSSQYKSVISLDIQNLTNRANDAFHYYDPLTEEIKLQKQLGLIPILGWRVEF